MSTRVVVVCPGRGSYGRAQLGSLRAGGPIVDALDAFRRGLGRPAISELDAAAAFSRASTSPASTRRS